MRHRNPNAGIVVFLVILRLRGYIRSISGLCRFLRKPKFNGCKIAQSKEIHAKALWTDVLSQPEGQSDVKFVPKICIVGQEEPITLLDILKEQKVSKYSSGIYYKTQIDLTHNSNHMEKKPPNLRLNQIDLWDQHHRQKYQ